ncbi:MAG: hypothetical protein KGK07_17275, partial [Chloroflexota bacterium]|nr:hypothetical protein [Chloroflexota bacterium]
VDAPFVNVDRHFDAYGLHYRMVDRLDCATPARLLKTHAMICLPGNRSPAAEPDAARLAAPILSALGLR